MRLIFFQVYLFYSVSFGSEDFIFKLFHICSARVTNRAVLNEPCIIKAATVFPKMPVVQKLLFAFQSSLDEGLQTILKFFTVLGV